MKKLLCIVLVCALFIPACTSIQMSDGETTAMPDTTIAPEDTKERAESVDETAVLDAFYRALEFRTSFVYPNDLLTFGEKIYGQAYFPVNDSRFSDPDTLRKELRGVFSEEIADVFMRCVGKADSEKELVLLNGRFIYCDGQMYGYAAFQGLIDVNCNSLSVKEKSENKVVLECETKRFENEISYFDFTFEKIDEKWICTDMPMPHFSELER